MNIKNVVSSRKIVYIFIAISLLIIAIAFSVLIFRRQNVQTNKTLSADSPLSVVNTILSLKGDQQISPLLCCELKDPTYNEADNLKFLGSLGNELHGEPELVKGDDNNAVVAINVSQGQNKGDWYFYLTNQGGWKLKATRTLALTGVIQAVINQYDATDDAGKLEMIAGIKKDDPSFDADYFLNNARLTLKTDKELILYFNDNKSRFTDLLLQAKTTESSKEGSLDRTRNNNLLKEMGTKLLLSDVVYDKKYSEYPGCYFFVIGGVGDNSVGYIHCSTEVRPAIDEKKFIILREIGDGWYLYKTT